jgi:hypothetical protein
VKAAQMMEEEQTSHHINKFFLTFGQGKLQVFHLNSRF